MPNTAPPATGGGARTDEWENAFMTIKAGLRTTALVTTLAATALVAAPRDAAAEFDSVRWQIPMSFASTLTALRRTPIAVVSEYRGPRRCSRARGDPAGHWSPVR